MAEKDDCLPYELPDQIAEIDELWKQSDYVGEEESFEKPRDVEFLRSAQAHIEKEKGNDRPGAPFLVGSGDCQESDRVRISWTQPSNLSEDEEYSYHVRYKEKNGKWQKFDTDSQQPIATITNLKADTGYIFKVRVSYEDDEGPFGPESEEIRTVTSPARSIIKQCHPTQATSSPLKYPLPLKKVEVAHDDKIMRSFVLGDESVQQMEKTILLVGATGSGKSTLVDGMVNYILGVNWEDDFRFHVVELEESRQSEGLDQTRSQTEHITCYTVNPPLGSRFNYRLRIIDTPGFGDTHGIQRDAELVAQIKQLFTGNGGIQVLDGICFLAKAPDARLTKTQKYIFEQILLLFGKDVESNICPLITFSDDREPPVLSALEQYVPCQLWFGFNNSALFADNKSQNEGSLSSFFWEMGKTSYQRFFSVLEKLSPKSLCQTKEVLLTRHKLQRTISELQKEVKVGIQKVGELETEIEIFKEKEQEFIENKSFKYTVVETIPIKDEIQDGQRTTNCDVCKKTCHFPCTEAKGKDKSKCSAMDRRGKCLQCKNKCSHAVHKSDKFTYAFVQVPVVRSRADMEEKYKKAGKEMLSHGAILAGMHKEVSKRETSLRNKMEAMTTLNNKLREIALMPEQVSLLDYIDLLMAQEERSSEPGSTSRLKILRDIKGKAEEDENIKEIADNTAKMFGEKLQYASEQAHKSVLSLRKT